jgi:hypothetical protein
LACLESERHRSTADSFGRGVSWGAEEIALEGNQPNRCGYAHKTHTKREKRIGWKNKKFVRDGGR